MPPYPYLLSAGTIGKLRQFCHAYTMPEELHIRQAGRSDCALILEMIRELARYEKLEHEVVATLPELEASLFDEAAAEVILGYCGTDVVGFALFFHNYSTFLGRRGLYLEDLYIKPEFRSRGFGRQMLAYLARIAVERNCGRLEWWVLDWNKSAIGFYKKLGAEAMDDWTVYRLSDEPLKALASESPTRT